MTSVVLAPYSTIATILAERLAAARGAADPFAPWPEEVVVASRGVADAIARELLQRVPGGVAGLQLQSIETLATRIVNAAGEYPRIAGEEERRLAMRTAARTIADPLTSTRGAAAMLYRSYRDVRDSGITVDQLADTISAARGLRNRDRTRLLVRVWRAYERLVEKLGAVDPADVLLRAASLATARSVRPQVVAGFYDMTGAQLALVEALRQAGLLAAVCIPYEVEQAEAYAFAEPFRARFGATAAETSKPGDPEASSVTQALTREDEIAGVCGAIAALLEEGARAAGIGVVVRAVDPYDLHLFHRFARRHGFGFAAAESTPLTGHRFGRTLALLLRLRERNFPRADVLEIARSGLALETRIDAERADLETRAAGIAGGSGEQLAIRGAKSDVLRAYDTLVAELGALTRSIDAGVVGDIVDGFRPSTADDLAALQALRTIVDAFRRAEVWRTPFDASAFGDALASAALQRDGTAEKQPTVWLGDVMRFRGRSFRHLFAPRMQDHILPQRRIEDPLLPDADRRLLGLREIGDGRAEEQLLFRLICGGGSEVHFSFAASDGFGTPLRPSSLLKRLGPAASWPVGAPQPAAGPADSAQQLRRRPLQLLARAGRRSAFDGYVRSETLLARAAAALGALSPTQLEDFGECPQKFFLKHLLGVRDFDDPAMEMQINVRDKGTVDHAILERFYRGIPAEEIWAAAAALPELPTALGERLDRAVDQEFEELDARLPAFNRPMRTIEREATRRALRQFVAEDISDLADRGMAPAYFEYTFGRKFPGADHEEPFVVPVGGASLSVQGKIDRIDGNNGWYRIVDYKSGKALRHARLAERIDRGMRLQLALYAMAVASIFGVDPARVSAAIKPLAGGVKPEEYAFELAEKNEGLRQTLEIFVAAITRGDFPAFPDDEACRYCPVRHSCRTRHDVDERRAAAAAGEPRTLLSEERS